MNSLKDKTCHELREWLNALNAREAMGYSYSFKSMERLRRHIAKLCDLLDEIERKEGAVR